MERQRAVEFLLDEPYKLGHMLGFTKLTELHNDWIRAMILGKEDETLQAHRGSYKTTCVSVALSLDIVLLPNVRTMFMRKTDNDIKEVVSQVKKILQSPHMRYFVQSIYGVDLKLTTSTAGEISTNLTTDIRGTAQLVGLGMGGSLTGKHFDRIFTDDIVNVQDRISKAERDRTKLIYQELQNIKNRGGRIFNTGTPWHKDDAFSLMPNAKKYDCYSTGLMTAEQIAEVKQQMTASLFAANYELRHIASEDVIFDNPIINAEPHYVEQGECHIDAAYGGEDWTAFTICRKHDGKYYVLGKCWRKHIDDVQDEIIKLRQLYNAGKIHCETNGDKGYLAKALKAKGERVSAYHENMNKFLKITSYLKSEWKNVYFVAGTDKDYIDQICDYNENAEHDDCPDSLASIIRMLWKKSNIDKDKLLFLR
jgi:predicted phage terminase large subunit-like protein